MENIPDKSDPIFNVMRQPGQNYTSPPKPKSPLPPLNPASPQSTTFRMPDASIPAPPSIPLRPDFAVQSNPPSGHKWIYIILALVVVLLAGGAAYYFLGFKKSVEPVANTSNLQKPFLNQFFNTDVCTDQTVCGDDADPDKDGMGNYAEFKANTNPLNPDTDDDGLADGDEVNVYGTEPTLRYTDRREIVVTNNWTDGVQIKNGFDPLDPGKPLNEVRKQKIEANTLQFHLHEPSITTTTTAVPPTVTPTPTPTPGN